MRIIVLGYIVRGPLGGLAWHHLQYVLGLKQLGHEVLFVEDSDDFPSCYDPERFDVSENPAYGLQFIGELFNAFDLTASWAYFDAHTNRWLGKTQQEVQAFSNATDVVLNLSGVNPVRSWWTSIPCRVYIDTDPGFTQIKHLTDTAAKETADQHTHFFSFGENIGNQDCSIPHDGFSWKATRQPVFLEAWKFADFVPNAKWTTVMQWDSYKTREYNGQVYGMKSLSFSDFHQLPGKMQEERFELALGSESAPGEALKTRGWHIINPLVPTKTPWRYQDYIARSKGEWTVAKHGYVMSNSGWFSERTLCYMASGKPVVVQDTGLRHLFETGTGLMVFTTLEQAIESIQKINGNYKHHCRKARDLVAENFNSTTVLTNLLHQV